MSSHKEKKSNELAPVQSGVLYGELETQVTHDEVFGEITRDGPNYRNVGWIGTVVLMMKSQIGLGVLSIPSAFNVLGYIPGLLVLLAIAAITSWSNYIIGVFKLLHPGVYSIDDAGAMMFGRAGRYFLGASYCLYWVLVAGSGMLSISIALNAVSTHGACTAIFVAVAAIIGFSLSSIQTLGRITWLAWVGLVGILGGIFTVTIAVGLQDRPASAPQDGPWVSDFKLFGSPTFAEGIAAVSSLVFAYSGVPGFFAIISEMRDPKMYSRSLFFCQVGITAVYITIGTVVYYFCGSYVASPALGSAGPLVKKVAYGIALPGLIFTTTFVTHLPAKYVFVRILSGSRHLAGNTPIHWITWLGCTGGVTIIAYVVASAIPVFDGLVSLVGALLGTLMSFQPMGCMWLYDNWNKKGSERTRSWYGMVLFSTFVIVVGTFLTIAGTYGSIVGIISSYKESGGSAAWSCADNSNSV